MHKLRLSARSRSCAAVLTALVLLVTSCGGPSTPPPTGIQAVAGAVSLPAGVVMDVASLTVTGPLGSAEPSSTGAFELSVFGGARTELGVETAAGDLLLLGATDGGSAEISLTSTAEALLYYAVGGMWLPPEQQDKVRQLLAGVPEAASLAGHLERQLRAGGNGVADPDSATLAALDAAHASLLADARLARFAVSSAASATGGVVAPAAAPALAPLAVEGSNIVIQPSTVQAGARVLHNPAGAGVVAQNEYRRPAAILAYEVAWHDADSVEHPVDPPLFIERVEVPATGQLELFNALLDVVTGDSPWSPVLSPQLNLAGHEGASRTEYRLVLIGASANDVVPAITEDPLFAGFQDEWDDIALEKSLELFLDELLLPLMEVYGLGSMAKLDAAKLSAMRTRVRSIHDKHLQGLGVFLTPGQASYANGLKFVIEELATNRMFRLDMLDMVRDALAESDKNKAAIEAMERRLSARASATAVAAAVQTVLVSGDVAKIVHDLLNSPSVVDWTALSSPSLFALSPERATITRTNSSARFTVIPKGNTTGNFMYRWTTSGAHGEISDLLQDGTTFDTRERDVWYFHDYPAGILDTDRDTVSVEVFELEAGATSIPAGASPIARMAASVQGDDRLLDSRITVNYGTTPVGMYIDSKVIGCAEMVLRFDAVPGAKSYVFQALGVGGQGDVRNPNQDFRLRGSNHSLFIDPHAKVDGSTIPDGFVTPYYSTCEWRYWADPTRFTSSPLSLSAKYDAKEDQFVIYLFAAEDLTSIVRGSMPLGDRVPLWYDWVADAVFQVTVNH